MISSAWCGGGVDRQPRSGNGCVHVSTIFHYQIEYSTQTFSLFYHIHSLDTNQILWLDFMAITDLFDVVLASAPQFNILKGCSSYNAYGDVCFVA